MNAQQIIETSIVKQATINCLPLPDLVLAEIKDCLFYDQNATNTRNQIRKQKTTIIKIIKQGLTSDKIYEEHVINYKRMFDSSFHTSSFIVDEDEPFYFYSASFENYLHYMDFDIDTFSFNVQYKIGAKRHSVNLQQDFCRQCGDYRFVETFQGNICSEKCICKCYEYM
jgi:hypothetical protein